MAQTQTVTILFCDLVGSTALMTRLGDDANDRVRRRLFAALREAVSTHRGDEVKSAGDGIMVAFVGAAADAVSCAVAMQRAVARLNDADPLLGLALRVGLSSGDASHEERDWFGVPVVEAARLEHAARPGQVLVSDLTRGLAGNRGGHTFTSVGALDLKGLPEPLAASEVAWEPDPGLPAIPLPSGLDRGGLTFVGREAQLATLQAAWDAAVSGERRLVLVTGETGIGKTRLAAEFASRVHSDHVVVLYGRSESDREIPFQPFAEALRWYVLAGQPAALREQVGTAGAELTRIVPALRTRLPDLPGPRAGDPASERRWLFEAVAHALRTVSERAPILLVLDDLERATEQTLAMLRALLESPDPMRLLVIGLAAAEAGASPWDTEEASLAALPGSVRVALRGLSVDEVATLLGQAEGPNLTPELVGRVHRETEGSPRFVTELAARLREAAAPGAAEAVLDSACPYMGLRPFEADDSALYFGRDEVVGAFLGRLAATRLLSVVGASGSGKSSLVRAGLVSRLEAGALPGSAAWQILLMTPGAHPLAELAPRLGALARLSAPSVLRDLESEPRTLDLVVRQALSDRGEGARVVLVVDQFEELFTLCRDQAERQRFIDTLLHAVSVPGGRTMAILAMRADFYGESARFPGLADALEASHALLGPMTPDDLRSAIERPAAVAGLRLEPGLSDRILRDVGDEPGGLPLLSHALLETWKRREGRSLTLAGYLASGGVRGAIAQTADTVYASLAEPEQTIARDLFVRLTELGEGTEDTRRRAAFAEVAPAGPSGEPVRAVITRLADARLLTTSAESVEVAHEALIREWPRLRAWLDDDRDGLRLLRHLTESAQAWERLGRDDGELYRGARLTAAIEWHDRAAPALNPVERDFFDASRELHEREAREARARLRRLRLGAAALAVLFVLALAGGALSLVSWTRAQDQRDRARTAANQEVAARQRADAAAVEAIIARLETDIPNLVRSDRSLAFALAAQAQQLQPGARGNALLNQAFGDDVRYLGRIWPAEPTLVGYALSPDGRYIATRAAGGLVELHEADSRKVVATTRAGAEALVGQLWFMPDGRSLIVPSRAGPNEVSVSIHDVPTLTQTKTFPFPLDTASFLLFADKQPLSADGRLLASSTQGSLVILDLRDGAVSRPSTPALSGLPFFDLGGRYLAAPMATTPPTLGVFGAGTYDQRHSIPAAGLEPYGWRFTPAGDLVLPRAAPVHQQEMWDVETGRVLAALPSRAATAAIGLTAIDETRGYIAFAVGHAEVSIFDLDDFTLVARPYDTRIHNTPQPAFGSRGDVLYTFEGGAAFEHWDLTGRGLAGSHTAAMGPGGAAVAPDGSWMVKQAPDGSWTRWNLPEMTAKDRSPTSLGPTPPPSLPALPVVPVVSANGAYFATLHSACSGPVCADGSVVVWNGATGRPVGEPLPYSNRAGGNDTPLACLAFHPDLPLLAVAGWAGLTRVYRVSGDSVQLQSTLPADVNDSCRAGIAFLPSTAGAPSRLAVWGLVKLTIWDVTNNTSALLSGKRWGYSSWAVTPAGEIATGLWQDLRFFRPEAFTKPGDPEPLSTIPSANLPYESQANVSLFYWTVFSPDGRWMAVQNADGEVALWDLRERVQLGGKYAAGGAGGAIVGFAGNALVVTSDAETIIWDLDTTTWAEKACFAAGRNLTETEWAKYFPGRDYEVTCPRWPPKPKT